MIKKIMQTLLLKSQCTVVQIGTFEIPIFDVNMDYSPSNIAVALGVRFLSRKHKSRKKYTTKSIENVLFGNWKGMDRL